LRLSAIKFIPQLFEALSKQAVKTTESIRKQLTTAQAVASAVKKAAEEKKK
jgi:hypothetical protein